MCVWRLSQKPSLVSDHCPIACREYKGRSASKLTREYSWRGTAVKPLFILMSRRLFIGQASTNNTTSVSTLIKPLRLGRRNLAVASAKRDMKLSHALGKSGTDISTSVARGATWTQNKIGRGIWKRSGLQSMRISR